ncbi:MAG: glycosyltransferase, partial [Bacilli bacterium]|nr:glycosyltransferase [Bacilli bacterium]
MNLTIIIPVFNEIFYTRQVIESIIDERERCKKIDTIYVIIVDNNSEDKTLQFLKSKEYLEKSTKNLKFLYVHNNKNYGYGGGANRGISYVRSIEEIGDCDFLIMNNDMVLLEGCIDNLITTAYSK